MASKRSKTTLIFIVMSVAVLLLGVLIGSNLGQGNILISKIFGNKVVMIPAGYKLNASLNTSLSSGTNRAGDVVTANITNPVVIGEDLAIPFGSELVGRVTGVSPAESFKAGKPGSISIQFNAVRTPNGKMYPISTKVLYFYGERSTIRKGVSKTVLGAATGAALGTAIGAIASGKKGAGRGAWSGAAIGGGLGATGALVAKGKEAIVPLTTNLYLTLEAPVQVVAFKQ